MMTQGSRASFNALDCSTVRSKWTLGWAKEFEPVSFELVGLQVVVLAVAAIKVGRVNL